MVKLFRFPVVRLILPMPFFQQRLSECRKLLTKTSQTDTTLPQFILKQKEFRAPERQSRSNYLIVLVKLLQKLQGLKLINFKTFMQEPLSFHAIGFLPEIL